MVCSTPSAAAGEDHRDSSSDNKGHDTVQEQSIKGVVLTSTGERDLVGKGHCAEFC